jgi:alpha-mannosidase
VYIHLACKQVRRLVFRDFRGAAAVLFALLFVSATARPQQTMHARQFDNFAARQTADALKALPSSSQAVMERLSKFRSIPLNGWRYHLGNVVDGQSVKFDDAAWQEIRSPYKTNPADILWLRKWIEIPSTLGGYDLRGCRVSVSLMVHAYGGDGAAIFANGEQIAQIDRSEPIILFYQPGDKVLLAVRVGRTPTGINLPAPSLHVEFDKDRPSPEDLYMELVSAVLLVPALAEDATAAKATLAKAIDDVDLKALDANDAQKFDASLRQAQQDLEPLKPDLQRATFHLTGNSHIDAAWLWPWTETVDIVKRTFGSALELMDEFPTFAFAQSAAQYNEWLAEKYPDMSAEIKQRIAEGRWEIVGGMWVEPDLNMPGGESLVRQLLVGQRTFQRLYGVTTRIGWNPDSFGYNWQLPQIYKKSGVDYFVTQKLSANETNPLPFKLFWWESPDGSKVLSYFPHTYNNMSLDPLRLSNDLVKARTLSPGMLEMLDLFGVGDHGGGPTRATLAQGLHWMQPGKVAPRMQYGTAQSYFSSIEKKIAPDSPTWNYQAMANGAGALPVPPAGEVAIPTWKDELYFEHHRGTYTTQAAQKRNMRESEEWMLNAEKFASMAWLDYEPYPVTELNEAWKKILFNQFHDTAAGSGIGVVYIDSQRDYDQVRWATQEVSAQALQTIQAHIDTRAAGELPILVFNPLGWPRSGLVHVDVEMPAAAGAGVSVLDKNQHVLPSEILSSDSHTNTYRLLVAAKDVPSLGYDVWHVVPGKRTFASDLHVHGMTLENTFLKVTVDPANGCITSIYDKKSNFEALAPGACGNQLQVFKDTPLSDDAWNIDPGTLDHATPLMQADSVKLVENTPLRAVIRITRTWQSSRFVQDVTLYANSDQVDVASDIDWYETHILLKAAFPLAASSRMATYEIPYGTIERPTTRTNSWDEAKFEVSAQHWADLGDGQHGFSLLNEAKYGYDGKDNVLRLTLLRSPVRPDPNADRGHHHFSYALYPHGGNWKTALTVRHGYEYNYPLQALQVAPHSGALPLEHSFISLNGSNVVLTAVKKAEDADGLILRFYEWAGQAGSVQINVPKGAQQATLTNLMEQPEGAPLPITGTDQVTVPVHPYEIVTVRVDYPI